MFYLQPTRVCLNNSWGVMTMWAVNVVNCIDLIASLNLLFVAYFIALHCVCPIVKADSCCSYTMHCSWPITIPGWSGLAGWSPRHVMRDRVHILLVQFTTAIIVRIVVTRWRPSQQLSASLSPMLHNVTVCIILGALRSVTGVCSTRILAESVVIHY